MPKRVRGCPQRLRKTRSGGGRWAPRLHNSCPVSGHSGHWRPSLFQFRYEPETTGDRQCEASRSVVDRKSISVAVSVAGEGSVMSIIGTRRAAARQAEGKARGEPVGNGGTA